jgi:hypothetical protein
MQAKDDRRLSRHPASQGLYRQDSQLSEQQVAGYQEAATTASGITSSLVLVLQQSRVLYNYSYGILHVQRI